MISDAIGLWKLIMETKVSDGSKSADETCLPAFQEPKSKNVCHLRLKRWRLNKTIVRSDKKGFLNMYWVPFWKKSSELLLKWHHIYWSTLWNLIKNGHSREWMWHCYLDCPRLENPAFQDIHARVSKDHGRRNGKKCFFITYSSSVTKASGNRSSESVFRWKLNRKIIPRGNLFMRFNLIYARLRKLRTVSLMFVTSMFSW